MVHASRDGWPLLPTKTTNGRHAWITLGVLSVALKFLSGSAGWMGVTSGMFMVALGLRYLIKYSSPDVRAKHLEYWTAKA
jgi:hypothetical protein